jgi:hypothetical protein
MKSKLALPAVFAALWIPAASCQDLPAELAGRWSGNAPSGRPITQTFALRKIEKTPTGFAGTLTWWTMDPRCKIEDAPIGGTFADGVLAFETKTRCDVPFRVELARKESSWEGKATVLNANVVLDVTAK